MELWTSFVVAHPIYSHAVTLLAGAVVAPRLLAWWDAKGVTLATDWVDKRQESLLKRAGLTDEQIDTIQLHEAKDLRLAADRLEARVKEQQEARKAA